MKRSSNVRLVQLAVASLMVSSAAVACGGGTQSGVPSPVSHGAASDAPTLFNPVLVTHSGIPGGRERRPASPPLVGCNFPYCMLQGDTIPLVWTDQAPVPITWSAGAASYFTASFNPNPTYSPPHQTTMTLTADRATPVGHYTITASITNADNSTPRVSGSNSIDMVVCDGVTGQCPGPTPTPSPTPSPTPTPTPPPPLAAKSLYTASLVSHPSIPLSDAAPQNLGSLTWHVSGQISSFKNIKLAATTAGPPHTNALEFDVADDLEPGDYSLTLNVSASSGTSANTVIVIRLRPPITYQGEINSAGLYEEDSNHNLIVSDGSHYTTDDDGVVPDFPYVAHPTDSLSKKRYPRTFDPHFNAYQPPKYVNDALADADKNKGYVCVAYIIESNSAADPTSGTAPGSFRGVAYCRSWPNFPAFTFSQVGTNLNRPGQSTFRGINNGDFCNLTGDYRGFDVCETPTFRVTPVLGHAEATQFIFMMTYLATNRIRHEFAGSFYIINKNGVFYPKIPIARDWAIPAVWTDGDGFVKFPSGPFSFCPTGTASKKCHYSDRGSLRRNLLKVLPPPPSGFDAHHIQPVEWCGTNDVDNGVFLPQDIADDAADFYTNKQHGKFNVWWATGAFEPDDPRPLCQ